MEVFSIQGCLYRGVPLYMYICISYVTSARYVAGINHEARGPSDLFRKRTERGRDITNLCRHEPAVMAKGGKFSRKTGL